MRFVISYVLNINGSLFIPCMQEGWTALMLAVQNDSHTKTVKILADAGADLNIQNKTVNEL